MSNTTENLIAFPSASSDNSQHQPGPEALLPDGQHGGDLPMNLTKQGA